MNISVNSSVLLLLSGGTVVSTEKSVEYDVSPEHNVASSYTQTESPFSDSELSRHSADSRIDADSNKLLDVGILGGQRRRRLFDLFGGGHSRGLQEQDQASCAFPETCEEEFCKCSIDGSAFSCARELDDVCNGIEADDGTTQNLSGCVPKEYYSYYSILYCKFASCAVGGGSYAQCECDFYRDACDAFGDVPDYKNDADVIQACFAKDCCVDNNGVLDISSCSGSKERAGDGDDLPLVSENELQETPLSKTLLTEGLQLSNVEGEERSTNKLEPSEPPSSANKGTFFLVGTTALVAWLWSFSGY